MTYEVIWRFWGSVETTSKIVKGKTLRDKLWHELETDPAITYIATNQILKDGTTRPIRSLIIGIK